MGRLPQRLPHGEGATVVDHLEELRSRIIVVLCAIALATIVAFEFHGHILDCRTTRCRLTGGGW